MKLRRRARIVQTCKCKAPQIPRLLLPFCMGCGKSWHFEHYTDAKGKR